MKEQKGINHAYVSPPRTIFISTQRDNPFTLERASRLPSKLKAIVVKDNENKVKNHKNGLRWFLTRKHQARLEKFSERYLIIFI
jgi:hypothetical protein